MVRGSFGLGAVAAASVKGAVALTLHDGGTAAAAPEGSAYYWPTARGPNGLSPHARGAYDGKQAYGVSPYVGPTDLSSSLLWEWHHPDGRYHTVTLGVLIDDRKNIYLASDDSIRKFSADGQELWRYVPPDRGTISQVPSLMDGAVYGTSRPNSVFALNMSSGDELWVKRTGSIGSDTGFVGAFDGKVLAYTDVRNEFGGEFPCKNIGSIAVRAFRASDGGSLWTYTPDEGLWNWFPNFAGDGTVGFQDHTGRAYRVRLDTGEVIWKAGGVPGTFTDGSAIIGPDGVLYAVGTLEKLSMYCPGTVTAYRWSDGEQIWQNRVPMPPNIFPAVGRLSGADGPFTVVQAIGLQCALSPNDVYAFDAATGNLTWKWTGPYNSKPGCAGDMEGLATRQGLQIRAVCLPNPWSAPTIDPNGRIFLGDQDGKFYAIRNSDGDKHIDWRTEVSKYDTLSAFGSPGSAHAPGMTAIASCDGLFVFGS